MSNFGSRLVNSIKEKGNKMEGEMSFFEHLEALRWHLIRSVFVILLFAIFSFIYFNDLFDGVIMAPTKPNFWTYRMMCRMGEFLHSLIHYIKAEDFCVQSIKVKLINTELAGQFNLQFGSSIMLGFILALPYILFEIWRFIRPALHTKERKAASGFVFYSTTLFIMGVLFGYYIITPLSVRFFAGYQISDSIENLFSIDSFISSETWLTLLTGLVFQLPIVVYILSSLSILTPKFMREKRRYAVIIVLLLAALITPSPDALTMMVVAMPLYLLFEFSIFVSALVHRRKAKKSDELMVM
jgi:sec-independent protein translocase protein TatC